MGSFCSAILGGALGSAVKLIMNAIFSWGGKMGACLVTVCGNLMGQFVKIALNLAFG